LKLNIRKVIIIIIIIIIIINQKTIYYDLYRNLHHSADNFSPGGMKNVCPASRCMW